MDTNISYNRKNILITSSAVINMLLFKTILDYFDLHNTIYSRILIGVAYLIGFVIFYFYFKNQKAQGRPVFPLSYIIPLAGVFIFIVYFFFNHPH